MCLSHFRLIFVYDIKQGYNFIQVSVFSTLFIEDYSFPIVYYWCPFWRLADLMCLGLFLGYLFYSLIYFVFLSVPVLYCRDDYGFMTYFEIKEADTSSFVLSQDCLGYLGSFVFSIWILGWFILFYEKRPVGFW